MSNQPQQPDLLFVYGTLHPDHAPEEMVADVKRLVLVDAATVQGKLFQLEEYPALVVKTDSPESVPGFVFELPGNLELLARLDSYEGFIPEAPETSLFLRERIEATLADDTTVTAWAYLYNRQLTVLIPS
jgi:gamma-glutamylcyclotransferase (GGCT)/AIG2-like uncharacterized protein YtfP